jgi:hypothetical protein
VRKNPNNLWINNAYGKMFFKNCLGLVRYRGLLESDMFGTGCAYIHDISRDAAKAATLYLKFTSHHYGGNGIIK